MPTAKKLPSGSWRCLVYSHTEKVWDAEKGVWKDQRKYESFTSDDTTLKGKAAAELMAAQFKVEKAKQPRQARRKDDMLDRTVSEAIDRYLEVKGNLLSPTTIQDYRCIQRNAFPGLMGLRLRDLDEDTLDEAINAEYKRVSKKRCRNPKPISPKRVRNEWGLLSAILNKYHKGLEYEPTLLDSPDRQKELIHPQTVLDILKGDYIELPALLAIWLSFSLSEIRGLTKSRSISADGQYLTIREVVVDVDGEAVHKELAKNRWRNRTHRIPPYIRSLIEQVPTDELVTISGRAIYHRWVKLLRRNGLPHMTFHDLRHESASIMALLRVPDKYAMERGGWKSDKVMKKVYTHTFPEERQKVDNIIDGYFEELMQHDLQHDIKKAL